MTDGDSQALCEKCSNTELFWSVFSHIWTENLSIQSKCGKTRTRKTLYLDNFHAVKWQE